MADSEAAVCNLALLNIGDTKGFIATLDDLSSEQAQVLKLCYAHLRDVALRAFKWPFAKRRAYPAQLGGALWAAGTTYAQGDYVSYAPNRAIIPAPPETLNTFVYVSLSAANTGHAPDSSPTWWRQISRAEWAYAFQLPTDIVRIRGLYRSGTRNPREDQKIPHETGYEPAPGPGQVLFTDACLPGESPPGSIVTPLSIALDYTARVTDTTQFPEDFTQALAWALAEKLYLSLKKDPAGAKVAHDAYVAALAAAQVSALKEVRRDTPPVPEHIAARR